MTYRDGALFELLPAIHRTRDIEEGGPLAALAEVLGEQADELDENLRELYDNWFIETCEPWVVPYLGELLRVRRINDLGTGNTSARGYVANTLRYRRRKGTIAVIEELARDVTGWQARAAEFFLQLDTTQHLNHVRSSHHRCPDLRNPALVGRIGGPFDSAAHTVDVRRIASGRGTHNISDVGIFLWRLEAYPVEMGTPRPVENPADGRYRFSPLGRDIALFNLPDTEEDITELATEVDVPGPLLRRPIAAEADARRQAQVDGTTVADGFLRDEHPAIEVFVQDGPGDPITKVPTERIQVCDLEELTPGGEWRRPGPTKEYVPSAGGAPVAVPIVVAVDPERGRLAFPAGVVPNRVRVSYGYAFSGDVGGGPYPRPDDVDGWSAPPAGAPTFSAVVTQQQADLADDPALFKPSIVDAVAAWHAHITVDPASFGVIAFNDSGSYPVGATPVVEIPEGARLAFVAGDAIAGGGFLRQAVRPHVIGSLRVRGSAPVASDDPGRALVDGLLIEGDLTTLSGHLGELDVMHSTVTGQIRVLGTAAQPNDRLDVIVERVIAARVTLGTDVPGASITGCVLHADGGITSVVATGADVTMDSVTAFGSINVRSLTASNCIYTGLVRVTRAQTGCVRFSYVAPVPATRTPRRYRCQPDLALHDVTDPAEQAKVEARVVPLFTSREFGHHGFSQLARAGAAEIGTGADDEAEMGVFRFLAQPQRRRNLAVALGEYLKFGMEAGVFDAT